MRFDEYRRHDGLGLAALIARGEVSADEVLEAALARADVVNPSLNAIVVDLRERARAGVAHVAARESAGPFTGVPFLVKDLFQECAGVPSNNGCRALHDAAFTPAEDAEIVRRWRAAGLVIFGRTNTPEFGAKGITEPELFGPTRNPWNTAHNPGGSSGGSAAAVASGIVPLAGANDGGGSIRIPASWCGLFGFKPGRARTPWSTVAPDAVGGLAVNHVISRSVRDSAAALDATCGPDTATAIHPAPPVRPYLDEAARDPARLRIGFSITSPIGTPVHPEALRAVQVTAKRLADLGHEVFEAAPAIDGMRLSQDFLQLWFAQCAAAVAEVRERTGCSNHGFEADTRLVAALGRALSALDYAQSQGRCAGYVMAMAQAFERFDLWLTPATAHPAPRIGEIATPAHERAAVHVLLALGLGRRLMRSSLVEKMIHDNLKWVPFTQLANLTGLPAMSVPMHWTPENLPIGVQFVGPVGGEGSLFQLAGQLERAYPWFERVPA